MIFSTLALSIYTHCLAKILNVKGRSKREAKCLGSQREYGDKSLRNCKKTQFETNKQTHSSFH